MQYRTFYYIQFCPAWRTPWRLRVRVLAMIMTGWSLPQRAEKVWQESQITSPFEVPCLKQYINNFLKAHLCLYCCKSVALLFLIWRTTYGWIETVLAIFLAFSIFSVELYRSNSSGYNIRLYNGNAYRKRHHYSSLSSRSNNIQSITCSNYWDHALEESCSLLRVTGRVYCPIVWGPYGS